MNYFTDQQVRSAAEKGIGKDWDVFTTLDEVRALMNLAVSTAIGNQPKETGFLADIGQLVMDKMKSGNSIPVERCTIRADEIATILGKQS
jgi:hypothetical protein